MKPLNMLTQGLALQSALQPLAGKTGSSGAAPSEDGGSGLDAMLQGLNLPTEMGSTHGLAPSNPATGAGGDLMQKIQQLEEIQVLEQLLQAQEPQDGEAQSTPPGQGLQQAMSALAPMMQGGGAAPAQGQAPAAAAPAAPPGVATGDSGIPGAPNTVPKPTDKPTDPSKSVDDYLNANNSLLGHMGNQEGMKDKLKARYGDWDDTSRSQADREQSAYNAARHVGTIKNKKNADGEDRGDVTKNGKMEGCTKDGDIRDGTEMGDLKNSLKTDGPGQDKNTESILGYGNLKHTNDDHVTKNGTNEDNAAVVGKKILQGLGKVAGFFKSVIDNTLGKIPGIGKVITAGTDLIAGGISDGLDAAGDAAGGDLEKARDDAKKMGHDALATISQAADQASGLLKETVGKIPGIGKFLAAGGEVLDSAIVGATNVGDTALKGGDVGEAARNMGKNIGGAALGAAVGLVDPTGIASGMAEQGLDSAIGAKPQVVQS